MPTFYKLNTKIFFVFWSKKRDTWGESILERAFKVYWLPMFMFGCLALKFWEQCSKNASSPV